MRLGHKRSLYYTRTTVGTFAYDKGRIRFYPRYGVEYSPVFFFFVSKSAADNENGVKNYATKRDVVSYSAAEQFITRVESTALLVRWKPSGENWWKKIARGSCTRPLPTLYQVVGGKEIKRCGVLCARLVLGTTTYDFYFTAVITIHSRSTAVFFSYYSSSVIFSGKRAINALLAPRILETDRFQRETRRNTATRTCKTLSSSVAETRAACTIGDSRPSLSRRPIWATHHY